MNRARLLLAEDHIRMRAMIACTVEREFEVVGAVGDGQELVEAESRLKPDVCIIDISMPVLDGFQAVHLLQRNGSVAKIVFLTSHTQEDYLEAALETGALGYVLKPRMVSDLRPAIREALAGRRFISPPLPQSSLSDTSGDLS